jgi:hypothetical protein
MIYVNDEGPGGSFDDNTSRSSMKKDPVGVISQSLQIVSSLSTRNTTTLLSKI